MLKQYKIEYWVIALLFLLLPVDMLNGIMLHNNILLPVSIGQLYKLVIIALFLFSFLLKPKFIAVSVICFLLLLTPSLFQVILQFKASFLFGDSIKIFRYLMPFLSFMFFVNVINRNNKRNKLNLFKLINFSYFILVFNILLKYIGLGYPSYKYGDIGSKGYFFAGNEISALLIILSAIIGFRILQTSTRKKYYLFFLFNIFIGITISSKTGMLGVLFVFLLMPLKGAVFKINQNKLKYILGALFALPLLGIIFIQLIKGSAIFARIHFFWNKLDFLTFILSNRNTFVSKAWGVYVEKYNAIEKIIGVGQTHYEKLNGDSIVEIDIVDVFFAYGIMGVFLFTGMLYFVYKKAKYFKSIKNHPYASLVFLLLFILIGISTVAGHVFSSGMSAVFIGLLFSLMYIKNDAVEN